MKPTLRIVIESALPTELLSAAQLGELKSINSSTLAGEDFMQL